MFSTFHLVFATNLLLFRDHLVVIFCLFLLVLSGKQLTRRFLIKFWCRILIGSPCLRAVRSALMAKIARFNTHTILHHLLCRPHRVLWWVCVCRIFCHVFVGQSTPAPQNTSMLSGISRFFRRATRSKSKEPEKPQEKPQALEKPPTPKLQPEKPQEQAVFVPVKVCAFVVDCCVCAWLFCFCLSPVCSLNIMACCRNARSSRSLPMCFTCFRWIWSKWRVRWCIFLLSSQLVLATTACQRSERDRRRCKSPLYRSSLRSWLRLCWRKQSTVQCGLLFCWWSLGVHCVSCWKVFKGQRLHVFIVQTRKRKYCSWTVCLHRVFCWLVQSCRERFCVSKLRCWSLLSAKRYNVFSLCSWSLLAVFGCGFLPSLPKRKRTAKRRTKQLPDLRGWKIR